MSDQTTEQPAVESTASEAGTLPIELAQPTVEQLDPRITIELNRSIAEANNSLFNLQRIQLQVKQAEAEANRPQTAETIALQQKLAASQLDSQEKILANNRRVMEDFQKEQLENLKETFKILFKQTKGAAWMFYSSFVLGIFLIITSVASYLFLPNSNDTLTLAFFGAGALTMLTFFLRDPAEKVQQTAGKLVQIQFAMKNHLMECGLWETYFAQRQNAGEPVSIEDFERASKSLQVSTQTIMRQIDESLDGITKDK